MLASYYKLCIKCCTCRVSDTLGCLQTALNNPTVLHYNKATLLHSPTTTLHFYTLLQQPYTSTLSYNKATLSYTLLQQPYTSTLSYNKATLSYTLLGISKVFFEMIVCRDIGDITFGDITFGDITDSTPI